MMKKLAILGGAVLVCCAGTAFATDLNLTVSGPTTATPGETVDLEIRGLLSDTNNEGLALFGFDLAATAGGTPITLYSAATVTAPAALSNFVSPDGLNNPMNCGNCFGFGGTADGASHDGDVLLQIGGGQNTINNDAGNAEFPVGTVDTGVAQTEEVLANVQLTLPSDTPPFDVVVEVQNPFANIIQQGETGPVYATEAVAAFNLTSLTITVSGGTPPAVSIVDSIVNHGSDIPLQLVGAGATSAVEPRQNGITTLEVEFDMDMDTVTFDAANVAVAGVNAGAYGGVISVSTISSTVASISFSPALANADCHTVDLTGMQSSGGQDLDVPTFNVVALAGDIDRNGTVSTSDSSAVKSHFGEAVDPLAPQYDYDGSGTVTTSDGSAIKASFGTSAPACP